MDGVRGRGLEPGGEKACQAATCFEDRAFCHLAWFGQALTDIWQGAAPLIGECITNKNIKTVKVVITRAVCRWQVDTSLCNLQNFIEQAISPNHIVNPMRNALVFSATVMACSQACALDLDMGHGVQGKFNGVVTLGSQIRTESPSPDAYADWPSRAVSGVSRGTLQGQTGGSDLNFGKGDPISTVLKAVLTLDLKKDNLGLFVRGHAWKDVALGERNAAYGHYPNGFQPNQPLSDQGFASSARFSNAEFRDVFVHGQFDAGQDKTLGLRLGRQVLEWGGSVLHTGGINAGIHPFDAPSLLRPGATPAEGKLPLGMLSAKWASGSRWRLEAFTAYESRASVLPGCGTYFDVVSFAPQGCNFAALPSASEQTLLATQAYLHRNADVKAKNAGQYGLAWGYKFEPWGTDVTAFAMNTHSALPSLRMTVNALTPGVRSVNYAVLYPQDVSLWGISFQQKTAAATRVFGELAYRPNQPITLNAFDVVSAFVSRSPNAVLALNKGILAIPVGGTFDANDRFGVVTGSLGVDTVFPKTLGADRVVMLAEIGFSHVNGLPDTSLLRYGRPLAYNGAAYAGVPACVDAVPGKTCTSDGYISPSAWGLKMVVSATYAHAVSGIGLTPSLTVSKDIKGYAYDGAYSKGRTLIRPALRAEIGKSYFADIQYSRYSGGKYNLLTDRDFISLVAGARF